uniref:Uncharacterized protein n=1 Tax=Anguilla anguilla TaxID=7936 RepID=A0A0E9QCT8_ANGAN
MFACSRAFRSPLSAR